MTASSSSSTRTTYEVPDEDWDVDSVIANFEQHMAKGSAMAVSFEQRLEPVFDGSSQMRV